ncbi:hypothetical protein CPB85DRAFT_871476 [Mucidula mucida]|nr:hypothetical protein CPB85DRAFT_288925 [Mucidula mucida]KAF8906722.1 hypothetical protein CPB85DRAFT_871476 [Mucidula mucida]
MMNPSLIRDICSPYDWIESFFRDSALKAVLSHNDEPTSLQATSIASSKEHIDLALSHITQDIDNLQKALRLLRMRQLILNTLSTEHGGALSSFRRLPNEILLEIFLHAYAPSYRVARVEAGPWKLRAVCRKWASIVEGCSRLWCNMVIDLHDDTFQTNVFMDALRLCASRHIHMTLKLSSYRSRQQAFSRLFDIFTPSSSRWESLTVVDNGDELNVFLESLLPRLEGNLPVLRSLTLRGYLSGPFDDHSKAYTALLTAPLLETVDLRTVSEDFSTFLEIVPLPFRQIRQLVCHSDYCYSPDLWKHHLLLSKAKFPLLERCELVNKLRFDVEFLASDRVEHDGVTHLVASQIELFNAFAFPSLRVLAIGDPIEEFVGATNEYVESTFDVKMSGMILDHVSNMLSASRCPLVSLVFSYDLMLVDQFMHVLHNVPTLEALDMRVLWSEGVERDGVLCQLFSALGSRPEATTFSFLPVLQDLRLTIVASYWLCDMEPAHEAYAASFEFDEDIQPRRFSFIPLVVEAVTVRGKYISDLRVFSLKMLMYNSETWALSIQEQSQLQDLESIKFYYDGVVMRFREPGERQEESDDRQEGLEGLDDICDCI